MITKLINKKQDFNDPEYLKWIRRVPVYIFSLIWYFVIVSLLLKYIILPLIRNNIDTIDHERIASVVLNSAANDEASIAILNTETFSNFVYEGNKIASYYNVTGDTVLIHLGTYQNNREVFIKAGSRYVSETFDQTLNHELIDRLFNGDQTKWQDDENITVYYFYQDLGIDRIDSTTFVNRAVETSMFSAIHNLIAYLLYLLPLLYLFFPKLKEDALTLKRENAENPIANRIINNFALMMAVSLGLGLLSMLLKSMLSLPSVPANQEAINQIMASNGKYLMMIAAVIIGPLVEEIIFRKVIFGLVRHDIVAIIISSVLFGLVHVTGESSIQLVLVNFIIYGGMGAFLGIVYMKNKHNLLLLYIIHALSNLLSLVNSL